MTKQELYEQMSNYFNQEELREIMFNLGIHYDDIAGRTRREKIRELIEYCEHRGRLEELSEILSRLRPNLDWEVPTNGSISKGKYPSKNNWKTILIVLFIGVIIISIIFYLIKNPMLPSDLAIASISPTATLAPTATLTPALTPTTEIISTCDVEVSDLFLEKMIVSTDDAIDVSVNINNPDNVPILFYWHANHGTLDPGLRTTAMQSTYTAPHEPTDDAIFLEAEVDGCDLIERTAKISILKSAEMDEPLTATSTPPHTPTSPPLPTDAPENTATPAEIPMILVESFENYTESLLREAFPVNTNAGNEGSLRLVGVPHTKDGVVALAFDYEIKNSGTGKNYIGFERLFPAQDWSNYTSFCVWLEGDGTNRDIVMQFGETGQQWKFTTPLSQVGTGELCVPLNDIDNANLRNIGYFGIFIEGSEGPPSTMYFDNIHVKKTQ